MDQAKGLRQMARTSAMKKRERNGASNGSSYPRVIAVTSGKGGVGKTNIVGNLAVAMTRLGKKVVIIDADVGLANIDIVFNLRPKYNIRHLVSGEKTLSQVMVTTDHGIGILPGGSGFADLTRFSEGEKLTLLSEFETFPIWQTSFCWIPGPAFHPMCSILMHLRTSVWWWPPRNPPPLPMPML